jgi:hypothetical protein
MALATWVPSSDAISASARTSSRYDDAPPWNNGAGCAGNLLPSVRAAGAALREKFPGITEAQGYNCRENSNDAGVTSMHGAGRALDLMIPTTGGDADMAVGVPVAEYLVKHAEELNVQFVIWARTYWTRAGSPHFGAYTGPSAHIDHVHVEFTTDGAALPLPDDSSGGGGRLFAVLAAVGLAGLVAYLISEE